MRGGDSIGGGDGGGGGGLPFGAATGDLGGSYPAPIVTALQGSPVSATAPTLPGQVLKWDGVAWVPAADATGVDYTATLWVDPNGDALSNGAAPAKPTTLANALALAPAGGCIVLTAGVYAVPPTMATSGVTLQGVSADLSVGSATAPVRITGLLTISAPNCRVIGIELGGGIADTSAAAGTTRVTGCNIIGPATVAAPASGQALELSRCDFASISVTGASGGATVRVRGTATGGAITHAGTGAVTVEVYESTISQVVCSGGGSLGTIVYRSSLTSAVGVDVSAGTATATTLVNVTVGTSPIGSGALVLTGAPAASVRAYNAQYSRLSSTIPAGSIVLARGSAPEQATVFGTISTSNPPASAITYVTLPENGIPVTLDPFTIYESTGSFTLSVTQGNTAFWIDLFINGVGSPIGALQAPLGVAEAQDVRALQVTFPGALYPDFLGTLRFAKSLLVGGAGLVVIKSGTLKLQAVQ